MVGGGAGGFHYDESLAIVGAPIGFRIARYVEDVREWNIGFANKMAPLSLVIIR
jgi:hypothetical protein